MTPRLAIILATPCAVLLSLPPPEYTGIADVYAVVTRGIEYVTDELGCATYRRRGRAWAKLADIQAARTTDSRKKCFRIHPP
jgi:hypothetical protein